MAIIKNSKQTVCFLKREIPLAQGKRSVKEDFRVNAMSDSLQSESDTIRRCRVKALWFIAEPRARGGRERGSGVERIADNG